ncbi:MAG TPA: L,D-transpeptidase family protein [Vicinamibacterales bacterium]|nr:L,D-transpeptidase family protein [Vicinamibacterales bacterium]
MASGLHTAVRIRGVVATIAFAAVLGGCRRGPAVAPHTPPQDLRDALAAIVSVKTSPPYVLKTRGGRQVWALTREFYQKRSFVPAWADDERSRSADVLIDTLQHADRDALDPARYGARDLARLRDDVRRGVDRRNEARAAMTLDARLTYAFLQYASDLAAGVTEGRTIRWKTSAPASNPLQSLDDALARDRVADVLGDLQRRNPSYASLREALHTYRSMAAAGGWPSLPAGFRVKRGERSPLLPALAKRLAVTGDYSPPAGRPDSGTPIYDETLENAVRHFQRRHGLEADGVVGKTVVAELNVPAAERVRQIELNLERWRWLPRDLGDRHILVNVPEYRLEVWDHGSVPLAMRVVVGKKDAQTPAFSSAMSYVVLAPFWNVPADIAENETLPSAESDPSFLERTHMEVVDTRGRAVDPKSIDLSDARRYRFRQRPGDSNSLGLVKFMFPNPYNVYLHDTPADALFTRETRAFSHGCVRIEQPEELADYVLRDRPDWTPDRIREAMHGSEQTTVTLREKIPVYIAYFTARVAPDGEVHFFRDIYGRDRQ